MRQLFTRVSRPLFRPPSSTTVRCGPLLSARLHLATSPSSTTVSLDRVWSLWNEGNLFSLSPEEITDFLETQGIPPPESSRGGVMKAALVRRLEEFLQQREAAESGANAPAGGMTTQGTPNPYGGRWGQGAPPPDALLDLSQSNFYTTTVGGTPLSNVLPKAFQLLTPDSSVDATVSRVNTTTFPGYPSSTECYTLTASSSGVSVQSRYSKVLQWCYLNMRNMQLDGELHIKLGKLLIHSSVVNPKSKGNSTEEVLSTYKAQQRLQLRDPYTWVTALPEAGIPLVEEFLLQQEGFTLIDKTAPVLTFEGTIRKEADVTVLLETDDKGTLKALHHPWVPLQTSYVTKEVGPDILLSLLTRPPLPRKEFETYSKQPLIELSQDDVSDVLPPELGQIIYLSENFTRRFEKVTEKGVVVTVKEVRRQPLIVLHDEEEDPRVEYTLSIVVPGGPSSRQGESFNVRETGVELYHLANRLSEAVTDIFTTEFGCA